MFRRIIATWLALAAALPAPLAANAATCDRAPLAGGAWKAGAAVGFTTAHLDVDADGVPDSYRVDGNGLSFAYDGVSGMVDGRPVPVGAPSWQAICNAKWTAALRSNDYSQVRIFGFLTDSAGRPVVQGQGDPLPGAGFVSATSLTLPGTPAASQRHYVDATRVPYIVLPPAVARAGQIHLGDLAAMYRPATGKLAFAVYADAGPHLGEASVKLHEALGNQPRVTQGGVARAKRRIEDATITLVFPGNAPPPQADADAWAAEIARKGEAALAAWGGPDRLKACMN